jgi:nicotinamidase-related amidase
MTNDLHGSAPDSAATALLLIDVINDFAFPDGRALLRHALPMARRLGRLKHRAKDAGIPAVYVNDNFGRWRSDFTAVVRRCSADGAIGHAVVGLLTPDVDDYFVLKPKHSGFYASTLGLLLTHLGVRRLILTGMTAPVCILFTASDAHMRDYELVIPRDCVSSPDIRQTRQALALMRRLFQADTRPSAALDLSRFTRASPRSIRRRPSRAGARKRRAGP